MSEKDTVSAMGCPYEIGGLWVEADGNCSGTLWKIEFQGKVPTLSAQVECKNGYRGTWKARNVVWEDQCQLRYQIVHQCTVCKGLAEGRTESHSLKFLNRDSAVLTLDNGTEIRLGHPA